MTFFRLFLSLFLLAIGFSSLPALAGGHAESLLRLGIGARSLGMGGAFVPLADDGSAAYWNPAGLAQFRTVQVTASHAFLFKNVADHSFINASFPVGNGLTIGLSWIYLKVDDIPAFTAIQGLPGLGPLPTSNSGQVYLLSIAKMFAFDGGSELFGSIPFEMPIAMNIKYLHQTVGTVVSNGVGLDFGLMARMGLEEATGYPNAGHLAMGLSVRDIVGTYVRSNIGSNKTIKPSIRMGFSYTRPIPWLNGTLILSEQHRLYRAENFLIGGEYWYRKVLAVRLGGYGKRFTTGGGVIIGPMILDYAYMDQNPKSTHRLGASFTF